MSNRADPAGPSGFWYEGEARTQESAVEILTELRLHREQSDLLRTGATAEMEMGERDLQALRMLIRADAVGEVLRQRDLAQSLQMRPPSVSALVDRLAQAGHAHRTPHPEDRRSTAVTVTEHGRAEVRKHLADLHASMFEVTASFDETERRIIMEFLRRINRTMEDHTPGAGALATRYRSRNDS